MCNGTGKCDTNNGFDCSQFSAEILFEALLKNATIEEGRPVRSVGREGLNYYNTLGYVPFDVNIRENAAKTLEYAYADFTIGQMAEKMGKKVIAKTYYEQSYRYKKVMAKFFMIFF